MKIWIVAQHQQMTGESEVDLFMTYDEALRAYTELRTTYIESFSEEEIEDGDVWREESLGTCLSFWSDNGDTSTTVKLGYQELALGGCNE
jgi:hypothetical protein